MTSIVNYTSSDSSEDETIMRYDTPICGPKSWKENRDNGSYNEELAQIFVDRLDDSKDNFFDNTHFSLIDYDLTITIPNIGPGKPKESINGSYIFNKNEKENIKYASCGNIARSVAQSFEEDKCGICNEGFCGEKAGERWYSLTKWKQVHQSCWKLLCLQYHMALKEENLNNTLENWILFLSNSNLIYEN